MFSRTVHRVVAPAMVAMCALMLHSRLAVAQQFPFSQRGTVKQTIAFTDVSVEYGRPVARGRALFGALVPWDSVWHPGADQATRITFTHDVTLEEQPVKAGTYSVWLIPREHQFWTFILSKAANVQHTPYPGKSKDYLRVDVRPDEVSFVESLLYSFPWMSKDEAVLRIQWGTTAIGLKIKAAWRPKT